MPGSRIVWLWILVFPFTVRADWAEVYSESFDRLPVGTKTASGGLPNWEEGSASGVVFDGKSESAGKFLIAASAWNSFNQGPIFHHDLSATPHDRVRVRFDLYTFGDWRGLRLADRGLRLSSAGEIRCWNSASGQEETDRQARFDPFRKPRTLFRPRLLLMALALLLRNN